jgi:rubrerythrin
MEQDRSLMMDTMKKCERNEINASRLYMAMAKRLKRKDPETAKVLYSMAVDERKHYENFLRYTGIPYRPHIFFDRLRFILQGTYHFLGYRAQMEQKDVTLYESLGTERVKEMDSMLFDEKKHLYQIQSILNERKVH